MENQKTITIDSNALETLESAISKIEEGKRVIENYSEVIGQVEKKDLKSKIIANLNRQLATVTEQIQTIGIEADDGLTKIEKRVKKLQRRGFWNTINNIITATAVATALYFYLTTQNTSSTALKNAQILEKYGIEIVAGENDTLIYVGANGAEIQKQNNAGYLIFNKSKK